MTRLLQKRPLRALFVACALLAPAPGSSAGEPEPTPTCDCPARIKPLEALESYDMIFFGQASFTGLSETGDSGNEEEFAEFSVEGIWKGPVQRRLRVHTSEGDPLCAFRFTLGERYLVYANLEDVPYSTRYRTSRCTRTAEASHALPDLAVLGPPQERFE
jgi:hypothetical protein